MHSYAWHWQRQADPWGSLDRQPSLMGESQASKRPCLNKTKGMTVVVVLWLTHVRKQIDTHMGVILHFSCFISDGTSLCRFFGLEVTT